MFIWLLFYKSFNSFHQVPNNLAHLHAAKPPKYMIDLYKAVANSDGSTKFPDQMNAETIRSVPNKGEQADTGDM